MHILRGRAEEGGLNQGGAESKERRVRRLEALHTTVRSLGLLSLAMGRLPSLCQRSEGSHMLQGKKGPEAS